MSARRSAPGAILIAAIPALLVVAVFVAHARLAHSLNINWDEFNFLSKIHSHGRGELVARLLTFHVHFFGWVRATSANEVDQILRIREVMFALGLVTAGATFFIGQRLIGSVAGALFAVFAGQSFSLVLDHGTSARYDPIVVCLFTVAAALLVSGRRAAAPLAGCLAGLCLLVSIKGVLYAPTLFGLLACRMAWHDRRAAVRDALAFALAALVSFVALFAWHAASLADADGSPAGTSASTIDALGSVAVTVFRPGSGPSQLDVLIDSLRWDGVFWALLAAGVVVAAFGLRTRTPSSSRADGSRADGSRARLHNAQLLCFALPVLALLFYRNAFAYFYVSIIPPAALLTGVVVGRIEQRFIGRTLVAVALVALVAIAPARAAFLWWSYNSHEQLEEQRRVIDVVHATFPEPVPYVDRCGMIASFRKVGPFMSTYTLTDYRARGVPIMAELLRRERPHFLLQNISGLAIGRRHNTGKRVYRLLREDFDTLTHSFIPHWGPLWVAGKSLRLDVDAPSDFDLLIAGRYVVEASAAVSIDGRPAAAGDVVELANGRHQITSTVAQELRLRIASARAPPSTTPPRRGVFRGFHYRTAAIDDDEEAP